MFMQRLAHKWSKQFVTAPNWKKTQVSTTDEWINTRLYIYTGNTLSLIKRNELLIPAKMQMTFKTIMQSERRQKIAYTVCFHLHKILDKVNVI